MEKKHMFLEPGREEMEGARRATGISSLDEATVSRRTLHAVVDPEVPEKASRRKFTADYKLRILKEAETCQHAGQRGALLRREGLYSSHLTTWRRQAERGTLQALSPRRRGPKARTPNPLMKQVATLEKENQHLRHKLKQAETIIEVQKKISEILHGSPEPKDGNKS
jgi:transposase-like protein